MQSLHQMHESGRILAYGTVTSRDDQQSSHRKREGDPHHITRDRQGRATSQALPLDPPIHFSRLYRLIIAQYGVLHYTKQKKKEPVDLARFGDGLRNTPCLSGLLG